MLIKNNPLERILKVVLLLIALTLFGFFSLTPSLGVPDIHYDEASWAEIALSIIHQKSYVYECFRFFNMYLPISEDGKHSALESYLLIPFVYLFGASSVEQIRMGPFIFGIITIIVTYFFSVVFFNAYVGIATVFLLALNPAFVYLLVKQGATYGFSIPIIFLSSLVFFQRYARSRKSLNLYLGMFLLSLGYNAKGYFVWLIISLFLTSLFLYSHLKLIKIKNVVVGLCCFVAGLIPIFLYYDRSNILIKYIAMNYRFASVGVYDNFAVIRNISARIGHFNSILIGLVDSGRDSGLFMISLFWFSYMYVLYSVFFKKNTILSKKRMFVVISVFSLTLLCSGYTFTNSTMGHLLMLMPCFQLIIGLAIYETYKGSRGKIAKSFVIILTGFVMTFYIHSSFVSLKQLYADKEENELSSSFVLTNWLINNNIDRIFFLSGDYSATIRCLSGLHITSKYDYDLKYEHDEVDRADGWSNITVARCAAEKIALENSYFLLEFPYEDKKYPYLKTALVNLGKKIVIVKEFRTRSGKVKFMICKLK